MIHLSSVVSSNVMFNGKKNKSQESMPESFSKSSTAAKVFIPTIMFLASFNPVLAGNEGKIDSSIQTELAEIKENIQNPTALSINDLKNAPSPEITIAGKKINAGIVVDVSTNKLYRYDSDGDVIDGYKVATGKIGRNGKSITDTGVRIVDHLETYPYKSAPGTKRRRNPGAYGPHILYLTTIDPKTGNDLGSNGEFIHGNNNPSSIGKYASHGCIRMDNDVITQFFNEVKPGTFVLIK